jgi:hypothetical protein
LACALELSGETSGLRLLLSHALRAASRTLIRADRLTTCGRLPLALLGALELKQFALLRTIQPPAAVLCCSQPVEALLLSFKSTNLPTLSPIQVALL